RGDRVLGRGTRHGSGEDTGPLARHSAQSLAALSDARLPYVGPLGLLSGKRRVRLPRPAPGCHGARRVETGADTRTSVARGGTPVHRGRRAALVATADARGVGRCRRSYTYFRRSGVAGIRHGSLRRG